MRINKKWLLVDDDQRDIDFIGKAISVPYDQALNLKTANLLMRSNSYAACIIDYRFARGEMTGLDLVAAIRDELPHMPIIMVSNSNGKTLAGEAGERGADAFIAKSGNAKAMGTLLHDAVTIAAIRRSKQ